MKRGYLGIFQGAYLAGRSAGHESMLREHGLAGTNSIIPLDKMLYVAAFQGGIERFVTPLKPPSDHPIDQFISSKVSKPKQSDSHILEKLLALTPSKLGKGDPSKGLWALLLMYDLIVAMENQAAVINVTGLPSVEDVRQDLPPDVAIPICSILSSLKANDELLPRPHIL